MRALNSRNKIIPAKEIRFEFRRSFLRFLGAAHLVENKMLPRLWSWRIPRMHLHQEWSFVRQQNRFCTLGEPLDRSDSLSRLKLSICWKTSSVGCSKRLISKLIDY